MTDVEHIVFTPPTHEQQVLLTIPLENFPSVFLQGKISEIEVQLPSKFSIDTKAFLDWHSSLPVDPNCQFDADRLWSMLNASQCKMPNLTGELDLIEGELFVKVGIPDFILDD